MVFRIEGYPFYTRNQQQTSRIMLLVCLATTPGILIQLWFFGWGTLVQIILGCTGAVAAEVLVIKLRSMTINHIINDNSALLTGLLLAISIPPLLSWWIILLGSAFSIIIAKQVYGGLGHNLFNPAMIGYAVLLISFPVQMTCWLPSHDGVIITPGFIDVLKIIFSNSADADILSFCFSAEGTTQATPLSTLKISPYTRYNVEQITQYSIYSDLLLVDVGWKWVNLAYLIGGLFLLQQKIIHWHIPVSFLVTLVVLAQLGWFFSSQSLSTPIIHLFSGSTMLGAFFILTDPVTASTTNLGRLIFGVVASALVWLIRSFGNYPDGTAFAVLLANSTVPLIDHYTCIRLQK